MITGAEMLSEARQLLPLAQAFEAKLRKRLSWPFIGKYFKPRWRHVWRRMEYYRLIVAAADKYGDENLSGMDYCMIEMNVPEPPEKES